MLNSVAVLGAGTWGMALARMLCNEGKAVTVWSALPQELEQLKRERRHPKLPGMVLPEGLVYTPDLGEACRGKDVLLFAVPSIYVRGTAKAAAPYVTDNQIIVDVAKGMDAQTLQTMTEVIADEISVSADRLVALSGPTHAEEVARDLPTTIVSSCVDTETAKKIQTFFSSSFMRVYTNEDVKGTEICGALKNIMALAAGISDGLGYGDNAKAAIITRGLAEMTRLGSRMGCAPQTFSGLTGMGDLIVTCTSCHSRNNQCGRLIGQGMSVSDAVRQVGMVVEGINALPAAVKLAKAYQVEMPIVEVIDRIVTEGVDAKRMVGSLLTRELKAENWMIS